jgi:hypothetical protein
MDIRFNANDMIATSILRIIRIESSLQLDTRWLTSLHATGIPAEESQTNAKKSGKFAREIHPRPCSDDHHLLMSSVPARLQIVNPSLDHRG